MEIGKYRNLTYIVKQPDYPQKANPAILFLHGAGTRGSDIASLEKNAFFSPDCCFTKDSSPFIVFAPQCHEDTWFDLFEQLKAFAMSIHNDPRVDSKRLYLVGTSMGGYATWQLAMSIPNIFAAAIPICGGGMQWNANRLVHLPIWAFHGKEDNVVPPEESIRMVAAVNRAGGTARLTLLEKTSHNVWNYAYSCHELLDWLLLQEKNEISLARQSSFYDTIAFG